MNKQYYIIKVSIGDDADKFARYNDFCSIIIDNFSDYVIYREDDFLVANFSNEEDAIMAKLLI